jgi:Uma2 family endonuclease
MARAASERGRTAADREKAMTTALKIGPADHGRPLTLEEFMAADGAEGYRYELIDGKLYVSPVPDLPHDRIDGWIAFRLTLYSQSHPEVVNYVSANPRVFVPGRTGTTCPEPDAAAYRDFPLDLPFDQVRWQDVSPVLVVEVLSPDTADKDLVRNRDLYFQVPSIREYWVLDTLQEGPDRPHLRVHRRWGGRWRELHLAPGQTYTTRLLPGFSLTVDPRR